MLEITAYQFIKRFIIVGLLFMLLAACERQQQTELRANSKLVEQGKILFASHCSTCHGVAGVGDANWRQKDKDGFWPAPPLNGSAHTWHHTQQWLFDKIKNGGPAGQSKMPAWKHKLSDAEILSILAYIQSLWPEPIYQTWLELSKRK